ncbi:unnamed protein product [Brassicogethes aeneus]|uniref:CDP-diacylglycerol--glycerol-3-phosphate 3-phosphatidyltransferase n=1 Tax=Brassicogethes aeneus TaxID=1431903 RepID=A0A9P0BKA8_BRAAE|nr:unnamed protein product [Brassicogethes aeneus]
MLRKILNSVIENSLQPIESTLYPSAFNLKETSHFSWLLNYAPCFPISTQNIRIITEPKQFYDAIIDNCKNAKKRITLVSLYLGNGKLEKEIVDTVRNNTSFKENKLEVNVLLDYTRGSRFQNNSRKMLQPLLQDNTNCNISLYHTPVLRGVYKKLTPNRWNELYGLQHMKMYIFDDTLIISGANLSNDYFTNRQDRYFMIQDKGLSDFYCGLVNRVQKFSLQMDKNDKLTLSNDWQYSPYEGSKYKFIKKSGDLIEQYLIDSKNEQNTHKNKGHDTWVFPLVQMGQLGIEQDSQVTEKILAETPEGSRLNIASGYFNLTSQYMETLINSSRGTCSILMAHPEANGFLGAKGAAGGIPYAYSLIAYKFKKKCIKYGQNKRLILLEYFKKGWTYHAKGLWYYPPNSKYPCLTLIGSPNFGGRSVKKDLESQLALITENEDLKKQLHKECTELYEMGLPEKTERTVPKWVYLFVFLFRDFF